MKKNNKIYISINGIGYGHASRILPLIKELRKENIKIFVSTYNEGYLFLSNYYTNIFKTYGLNYIFDEDGKLSFKKTLSKGIWRFFVIFPLHIALELRNLITLKPNLVISDSRFSTLLAGYVLGIKRYVIINQLYVEIPRVRPMNSIMRFLKFFAERIFFELWFWVCKKGDLILIPDFKPPFTIASDTLMVKKLEDLNKIIFIGPLIRTPDHAPSKYNKSQICVMPSGTLEERLLIIKRFIDIIKKVDIQDIEIKLFTGLKNFKYKKYKNLEIFPWLEEDGIEKFLFSSKIVVLTGGHSSIMKSIKIGKPILFIVPKAHTEKQKNATRLCKYGCAEMLNTDELNYDNFQKYIHKILYNYDYYSKNIKEFNKSTIYLDGLDYLVNIIKNG